MGFRDFLETEKKGVAKFKAERKIKAENKRQAEMKQLRQDTAKINMQLAKERAIYNRELQREKSKSNLSKQKSQLSNLKKERFRKSKKGKALALAGRGAKAGLKEIGSFIRDKPVKRKKSSKRKSRSKSEGFFDDLF